VCQISSLNFGRGLYKGLQGPHVSHHLDGPDLTFLQKLKVSPIRRHFSEKFAVTKMNAIDQFMSPRNFRSMSCLVIEKKLFFQTLFFISEVLSLCHRDGHIKSLILTKVFHVGN
jgi:hypothetical protein